MIGDTPSAVASKRVARETSGEWKAQRRRNMEDLWGAIGAAVVLTIASVLAPAADGHGTRPSLMPVPCIWRSITGLPCPSCGLTSAFTWMARGKVVEAWRCSPLGPPAYILTWLLLAWSLVAFWRRLPGPRLFLAKTHYLAVLLGLYLGVWVVRIITILRTGGHQ
jgi:hypothetical protein